MSRFENNDLMGFVSKRKILFTAELKEDTCLNGGNTFKKGTVMGILSVEVKGNHTIYQTDGWGRINKKNFK